MSDRQTLKGKHIFLLEDDIVNQAVMQNLLRNKGANVVVDHWGDLSLTRLQKYPFPVDLILLDIMLPNDISGYDICEAIRAVDKFKDVPIVFVSASDPDKEIPKIRELGLNGFISKPISYYEFFALISDVLNGKTVWA